MTDWVESGNMGGDWVIEVHMTWQTADKRSCKLF